MTEFGSNGHEDKDTFHGDEAVADIGSIGAAGNGNGSRNRRFIDLDDPTQPQPDQNGAEPPHNVERHSEDPRGALQAAGREVCDPEEIRALAAWLGKTLQALDPEWFEWLVRPLYRSVHDVRAGAIVGPARRAAGEQLKVVDSTEAAIEQIQAEGIANGEKAERLEASVIPWVEGEIEQVNAEMAEADKECDAAQAEVGRVRVAEEERLAEGEDRRTRITLAERWRIWTTRNLFGRISADPWKVIPVFLAELAGTTWLLASPVSDLITDVTFAEGLGIAFVISLTLLVASFAAGTALAAIRLPGGVIGVFMLGLFTAILVKFVPALDDLREFLDSGVETLTAATLAAFFVAMMTGYTVATGEDQRKELEAEDARTALFTRAGSPLSNALDWLDEAKAGKLRAEERRENLRTLLKALWDQVERLRDEASRAPAEVADRRKLGVEAEAELKTIRVVADAGVKQEEAAAEWATLIALAAQAKARAERPPKMGEPEGIRPPRPPAADDSAEDRPSALQMLALGTVGVSGIASLVLGPVPLGVGLPVAALLAAIDRWSRRRSGGATAVEPDRRVVISADEENPLYMRQPDRMVPKYRDGGAGTGERQR